MGRCTWVSHKFNYFILIDHIWQLLHILVHLISSQYIWQWIKCKVADKLNWMFPLKSAFLVGFLCWFSLEMSQYFAYRVCSIPALNALSFPLSSTRCCYSMKSQGEYKKREKNVNLGSKSAQCFIPASCPPAAFYMTFCTAQYSLLL